MNFIQPNFLIFLFCFCIIYRFFGQRARITFGILGSFYFYAYFSPLFSLLLLFSSLVDYICGKKIHLNPDRKRLWLTFSLICNLGILVIFKYDDFILENLNAIFPSIDKGKNSIPPMGISFFTFQTMSYTIDIYRGHLMPTRSFKDFLFYISFFPQLVAGPIVRAKDFLPQIKNAKLDTRVFKEASLRFIRGFAKKACLADSLGILIVDPYYNDLQNNSPEMALLVVIAYGLQLYLDFSGYSDMAIAIGKLLGFTFPENFKYPYLATSFSEFWKRWHISLSSWLRDYLYISLGGNRLGQARTTFNLLVTMLLGGLWHGAGWNFLIWGGLNGLYLVIEHFLNIKKFLENGFNRILGHIWVIGAYFFSLIFFRAENFSDACLTISKCASVNPLLIFKNISSMHLIETWQLALLICICAGTHILRAFPIIIQLFQKTPFLFKTCFYSILGFSLIHFYPTGKVTAFIYFQF